jgi:alpha-tubulin suppressor-like RCC1 family protein
VSVAGAVKTFCQISGGGNHTIAIDRYGRAWGWGINTNGRIGDGTLVSKLTPVSIVGAVRTFCEISCGNNHSLAIDKNGRAWAWGLNTTSQLGDGTMSSRLTPVSVAGNITFCKISAGNTHSLAIDKNGRAWGWGLNSTGQLGDNAIIVSYTTPINVSGEVKTFCEISGGGNGSLAIDKNGLVWGWGINTGSQIGDGKGNNRKTPVSVAGTVKTFCKISAGSNHSAAIDKYGLVWCWGTNNQGQLGINSLTGVSTPVKILGQVKTFCQINAAANSNRVNAIDKNGLAWGWGVNNQGGIGDNSTTCRLTPVSVLGAVKTFCQISGGEASTVAIDKNGRAWAWGINNAGQLGDNSLISRLTPVSVAGAVKTFCQITGSANTHTVAIDKNGRAWCWGNNNNGQLGDN